MKNTFDLNLRGFHKRFAIVKLWPKIKTAEDECIARIKIAAEKLGLECIEVHANGKSIDNPSATVSHENVDFVLHLHYDTPKLYDAYSIVALWNPTTFYHEWGYYRTSRNLTTHDDFISCSSITADDHVARMVRNTGTHLPPYFKLFHTLPEIVYPPSLGDGKLFYVGINWEAISGGKSRHQDVLKNLDTTGLLRIYGPEIFQNTRVWAGYKSYVKEIPFDGVSMIGEISKAGVALVLSSQAHKDSGLMSNRLFESIAAGALVICDENPWAQTHFGDSLLYIDGRSTAEEMTSKITKHLKWAQNNPDQAIAKIEKAQALFKEKYNLVRNITDLYEGLNERKAKLKALQHPLSSETLRINAYYLMPEYSEKILKQHLHSIIAQTHESTTSILITDDNLKPKEFEHIAKVCAGKVSHLPVALYDYKNNSALNSRKKLGQIIQQLIDQTHDAEAIMFVAPNESLFSNHIAVLAGALQRNPNEHCAATAAIISKGDAPIHAVNELLDFGHVDQSAPPGYGRFIFRVASLPKDLNIALPYLDGRPLAALVNGQPIKQELPATIIIDTQTDFPERTWNDAAENEVLQDYTRTPLGIYFGYGPRPRPGSTQVAAVDASLPIPPERINVLDLVLFAFKNPRWVKAQLQLIRKEGLGRRLRVLTNTVHL
jgi:hypothetical protein